MAILLSSLSGFFMIAFAVSMIVGNEAKTEIKSLEKSIETFELQDEENKDKISNLESSNSGLSKEIESLKEEITDKDSQIEEIRNDSLRIKSENKRLKDKSVKKQIPEVSRSSGGYKSSYDMTHYTAFCPTGCTGVTSTGKNVSNTIYHNGYRIVAAPPNIPFNTKLKIHYSDGSSINAIVLDRGGDIKGKRLDLLVSSREEAYKLGRKQVDIEIIN